MLNRPESFFYRYLFPAASFIFLLYFAYVGLFEIPYFGFAFEASGLVTALLPPDQENPALQVGDRILAIDGASFASFQANRNQALLADGTPGRSINLQIMRGEDEFEVVWQLPVPHIFEISIRVLYYCIPFLIWLIGALTTNFLRPTDQRWKLLISFNFLLAAWMMLGLVATVNTHHTEVLLRSATWLLLPVALHLHWVFPQPLDTRFPFLWKLLYSFCAVLVAAEWFSLLPDTFFLTGFSLALPVCGFFLWLHVRAQPGQRRNILLIFGVVGIVLLPAFILTLITILGDAPSNTPFFMFIVPVIPITYVTIAARSKVGWLELRANRRFTAWVFILLLISAGILVQVLLPSVLRHPGPILLFNAFLFAGAGMLSAWMYPRFKRWFSEHFLDVPPAPTRLAESYLSQMMANLERTRLFELLRSEILDGLLIRQAALIGLEPDKSIPAGFKSQVLFQHGVDDSEIPTIGEIAALLASFAKNNQRDGEALADISPAWVRLPLLAALSGQPALLCLFGRRDPDDQYAYTEIPTLQALIDQTALALAHLEQTSRLRELYQQDIHHEEGERTRLAHAMHDEVLTELALMAQHLDESLAPQAVAAYQASVQHIRGLIQGLHPNLMVAGLSGALQELMDEAAEQWAPRLQSSCRFICLLEEPEPVMYPAEVSQHLFRIVQHACWNALKHGRPQQVTVSGRLEDRCAKIQVTDDGTGFSAGERLDLAGLLAGRHYGLANMHERAALIGAHLSLHSAPGQGTRVSVTWEAPAQSA